MRASLILCAWLNSPRLATAMAVCESDFIMDEWIRLKAEMAIPDAELEREVA